MALHCAVPPLLLAALPTSSGISFKESERALWRETPMKRLPRIHAAALSDPSSKFYSGALPFVLTMNSTDGLGSAQSDWSIDWFVDNFKDEIVDWYPKGMLDIRNKPFLLSFAEAAQGWKAAGTPKWRDRKTTPYLQWRLQMATWRALKKSLAALPKWFTVDEAWLRDCLPERTHEEWPADNWMRHCHWKVLVLGKRGSGMFFHADGISTSTYVMQLVGRKRWTVCRPGQEHKLYKAGEVDVYDPDLSRFPNFASADCTRTIVGPGEILYYPTHWWHQTDNLDSDTISLAARRVDAHNYDMVYGELQRKCAVPSEDISKKWPGAAPPLSQTNCKFISKCHAMWEREFKGARLDTCSAEKAEHGVCTLE